MIRGADLLLRTASFLSTAALAACTSMFTKDMNRGCWHACTWFHGMRSIPDSLRLYMEANRAMTDRIHEALRGRRRARVEFDTAVAVWWLSDSGRPDYLPTLMRFAGHTNHDVASLAAYGLARHTGRKAVRARLLEVYESAPGEVRNNMVGSLAIVNDTNTRSLLREISRRDLRQDTIEMIDLTLSGPALPAGKGRWPCLPRDPGPWKGKCPQ
jgi:hypothetical protein